MLPIGIFSINTQVQCYHDYKILLIADPCSKSDYFLFPAQPFVVIVLVAQLCPTLCDPVDCSSPGSSVHGILQAKILEWVAIPSSRDLPDPGIKPRTPTLQAGSILSEPPGKPLPHM